MITTAAAIATYDKKILLLLRDNLPTIHDPNRWSLVGGHVEPNEEIEMALARDLKEEINVIPKKPDFLFKFTGYYGETIHLFHAALTQLQVDELILGEGQQMKFFSISELPNLELTSNVASLYKNHLPLLKKINGRCIKDYFTRSTY